MTDYHITKVILLTAILGSVLPIGCAKTAKSSPTKAVNVYIDDISDSSSATAFENAFRLEPACEGLHLYLYSESRNSEESTLELGKVLRNPHWGVEYREVKEDYNGVLEPKTVRSLSVYSPFSSTVSTPLRNMLNIEVGSAAAAARDACFVISGKGGQ